MRPISSCTTCRSRKKKCTPSATGAECRYCLVRKLPCNMITDSERVDKNTWSLSRQRRLVQLSPSDPQSIQGQGQLPSGQSIQINGILTNPLLDHLIGLYFDMIHNKQQILFHQQTFLSQRRCGQLPDYLVLAIAALVARFSPHHDLKDVKPCERASAYLRPALAAFNARLQPVSVQALQGAILLAFVSLVEDLTDQSSLLNAQAVRMVHVLRLADRRNEDVMQREIEIRLYWQAYMMDIWDTGREQIQRQLTAKSTVPLPLDEDLFEDGQFQTTVDIGLDGPDTRSHSLWSQVVTLNETYAEIVSFIASLSSDPTLTFAQGCKVHALTSHLDHWLKNLPAHLQNTSENIQRYSDRGRGREFAVLHLIFHHQCQLLHFPYLSKSLQNPSEVSDRRIIEHAARCKCHAVALSELMWKTNTTPGMECLWSPINGHLLVIASVVHLHTLLHDHDPEIVSRMRKLLEQNYVMLVQFRKFWPTLEASLLRLQTFQKSCYHGDLALSYQVDKWMVEFLLDHNSAIGERFPSSGEYSTPGSDSWNAESDTMWFKMRSGELLVDSDLYHSLSFV